MAYSESGPSDIPSSTTTRTRKRARDPDLPRCPSGSDAIARQIVFAERGLQPKYSATHETVNALRKKRNAAEHGRVSHSQDKGVDPSSLADSSPDSQPVRPAKRFRIGAIQRTHKPGPEAQTSYAWREDNPCEIRDEIEDSFEENNYLNSRTLIVQIEVREDFPRDDYIKVSNLSSQSTEDQDRTQSRIVSRCERRYGLYEGEDVIPDSQELLNSQSYKPSETSSTVVTALSLWETDSATDFNTLEADDFRTIEEEPSNNPSLVEDSESSSENLLGTKISPDTSWAVVRPPDRPHYEGSQNSEKDCMLGQTDVHPTQLSSTPQRTRPTQNIPVYTLHESSQPDSFGDNYRYSAQRPSPPSFSLQELPDTYGSDSLGRPDTPLDSIMADQHGFEVNQEMTVTEKLRQIRANAAAQARSLSGMALIHQSSPSQDVLSQNLPLRENVAEVSSLPSAQPQSQESDIPIVPSDNGDLYLPSKSMEHFVLLPMVSMVRDVYQATIYSLRREIENFMKEPGADTTLFNSMHTMIENLDMICDHQDLVGDQSHTQVDVPDNLQAKWAENCSTKCLFLRELLDALRNSELHIAIIVRPGRMMDILDALLKANKYTFARSDHSASLSSSGNGFLKITLLPTGNEDGHHFLGRTDAIIAFDRTSHAFEHHLDSIRMRYIEFDHTCPLISLIIANSAEHLDLCLPKVLDPIEKTATLVNCITQIRGNVGILDAEIPSPDKAATAVAYYLESVAMGNDNAEWPLPSAPAITGLQVPIGVETQAGSESTTQSYDPGSQPSSYIQASTKRPFKVENDEDMSKRLRMTPSETAGSIEEVTRVSNTTSEKSQRETISSASSFGQTIRQAAIVDDEGMRQVDSLLTKVAELETQLQAREGSESRLRQTIKTLEARLNDHVSTMKKIQPKYQEALDDRARFQAERDAAIAQLATITERMENRVADAAKLKEEKAALGKDVAQLRDMLATSSIPEIVELEKTRQQKEALQVEKEKQERKIASMSRDFEFTRESYQRASNSAVDLANELSEARQEISILQRKANQNAVRIVEIQRDGERQQREERITELESLLVDREMELWRKSEELKVRTNGRRETRGTSVPRSPRLASGAMSPRRGPLGGGNSSRQNSPAPGDMPRIREGFVGDAILYPPRQWNHLREGL